MFPCLPHYSTTIKYLHTTTTSSIRLEVGQYVTPQPLPITKWLRPANASQVPNGKQFWDGAGDVEVCGFTGGDNLDWLVLLLTQLRIKSYSPHPKSQGLECRPILVKHCLRAEQDSDINADGTAVLHHCEACAAPNVAV